MTQPSWKQSLRKPGSLRTLDLPRKFRRTG